jgi:hypothetical protein
VAGKYRGMPGKFGEHAGKMPGILSRSTGKNRGDAGKVWGGCQGHAGKSPGKAMPETRGNKEISTRLELIIGPPVELISNSNS